MGKGPKPRATDDDVVQAIVEIWGRGEPPSLREIAFMLGYSEKSVSTLWKMVNRAIDDGKLVSVTSPRGVVTVWTPELLKVIRSTASQQARKETQ